MKRSQVGDSQIKALDSGSTDAFSRWRVSNPVSIFDSQQQYGNSLLFWESAVVGTGVLSNSLLDSSVVLSTGGIASGAKCTRQSRTHFRYQPGKSQIIVLTFVFDGGPKTNVRYREGFWNDNDGIFLQLSGTQLSIVRRSSASGVVSDETVNQEDWNLDIMDGGGPSGVKLDMTKAQILFIDLQWLGVGRVRVGFDVDGKLYYVHEFLHANNISLVYMATANLPIRGEIENIGVAGSTTTMRQICASVISEGGFESERGLQFAAARPAAVLSVTTRRPVLTLRARTTGPNGVRNTGQILLRAFDVMALTNSCLVEIVLNGTLGGTAAVWTPRDASYSLAEFDIAATTISGGLIVNAFHVAGSTTNKTGPGTSGNSLFQRLPLVYTGLNSAQDQISIVVTATTGTSDINAAMTWQELY